MSGYVKAREPHELLLDDRSRVRSVSVVTIRPREKWYLLYVLHPSGKVESFDFGVLEGQGIMSYVDHVPNPKAVEIWAERSGYYVDPLALEMMVGRWAIEVEGWGSGLKSEIDDRCRKETVEAVAHLKGALDQEKDPEARRMVKLQLSSMYGRFCDDPKAPLKL